VDCCLSTSVSQIDIHHSDPFTDYLAYQYGPLDPLGIKLLYVFTNLEVLKINTASSANELDDTILEEIASTWPRLRVLQICYSRHTRRHSPRITINGLAALTKCRVLADLSLPFDSRPRLHPFTGVSQDSLVSVTFAKSSLNRPARIVRFFSQTFPNVSSISAYDPVECSLYQVKVRDRHWDETKDLFRTLRGEAGGRQSVTSKSEDARSEDDSSDY
jgi:hypothetical protein